MNNEATDALIKYRIQNAIEILDEAKLMLENNMLKGGCNRIYYALFNAVHGLAVKDGFSCKTHSGLQSYFNNNYLKTKIISSVGKVYNKALVMRGESDYQIQPELSQEILDDLFNNAIKLNNEIKKILEVK